MLELTNIVWNAPDGKQVLKNLSFALQNGKLVVITGPNGSGKTTLARLIAGIEHPQSGKILLDGQDITELNVTERAKVGVSYAFQQPVRFKGITVRRLLETAAGRPLLQGELCDLLTKVGLCAKDYADREVNATLSGGEIKRIEIASVLARNTKLAIFDEPEAGIDLWSFKSLIDVFRDMQKDLRGTVVIISHQERILRIADEILLLSGGRIAAQGSSDYMMSQVLNTENTAVNCYKKEEILSD